MNIGIVGLGRMGSAIAARLVQAGHGVFGYDPVKVLAEKSRQEGVLVVASLQDVVKNARIVWLMVPAGELVDRVIQELLPSLQRGDILIDGGNSRFTDSMRRAQELERHGISFLDCGTSGGVHGRTHGFCLMLGGDAASYRACEPLLQAIAAPKGYARVGESGAGHYVKMVHNGIEYGILQAYAEGFQIIKEGTFQDQSVDLAQVADLWNHGSVIRSWILSLAHDVLSQDQDFKDISGEVGSNGTGVWTADEAHAHKIPCGVLDASLRVRENSLRDGGNYATKMVAMLRNAFGGHAISKKEQS